MQDDNKPLVISGRKGGGDKENIYEAPNTLRARQSAKIVDAMCEGPIEGIVGGLRGIFLNETAVQNKDGTFNFKNVGAQWRNGTQDQTPLDGFTDVQAETNVGVELKQVTPVTMHLNGQAFDYARVTVMTPNFTSVDDDGDTFGTSVSLAIYVQADGAGFPATPVVTDTINGKTVSKYTRSYLFALPPSVTKTWDVRVTRSTPDNENPRIQNKTYVESIAGIVNAKLSYPNTALVGIDVDASQFSSIPGRSYLIRGLIVKVPSNYTPASYSAETGTWTPGVYDGLWDGTFKPAWTSNPAWCFYDLLMSGRYGLGDYFKATPVDKWTLYTIAQYCDELVPDGFGGMEPRFTCNLYLQSEEEAFRVVQNFASIFRAMTFYSGGALFAMQDAPHDPIALYTNANVLDGDFNYPGASSKQRHTVALVTWNDPNDSFKQRVEYVDDTEAIRKWGVIQTSLVAFGCSSRGQAHRLGKWLIATEQMCSETIEFKVGLDGCSLYPGAIIQTSDVNRAMVRMGGRITGFTDTTVTLDAPAELEANRAYTLQVVTTSDSTDLAPGTAARPVIFYGTVTNVPGTHDVLTLQQPVPAGLAENAVFVLAATDLVPETWRVIDVREGDPGTLQVSALCHIPQLYDYVEQGIQFTQTPTTKVFDHPPPVTDINVVASRYQIEGAVVGVRATVSWVSKAARYRIEYIVEGGMAITTESHSPSIDIENLSLARYRITVTAVAATGRPSQPTTIIVDMADKIAAAPVTLPPVVGGTEINPMNLILKGNFDGTDVTVSWDKVRGATNYKVEVGTSDGARSANFVVRRTADLGNTQQFNYSLQDMLNDGGPWRHLYFRVYAFGALGAALATYSEIDCKNEQLGQLSNVVFNNGVRCIYFNCDEPLAMDYAGIVIHMSATQYFSPSDATIVYKGASTNVAISKLPDGTEIVDDTPYYFRAGAYDALGADNVALSNEVMASSVGVGLKNAIVYAYQRSSLEPVGLPGRVEYDYATAKILTPTLANGWFAQIPDGTGPLWVTAASASSASSKDFIEANEWSGAVVLATSGDVYVTHIESSHGDKFKVGQPTAMTLKARVFCNGLEITDDLPSSVFKWRRRSFYPVTSPTDEEWAMQYSPGYKQIEVTFNEVHTRATFTCDIMSQN